MANFSFKGRNRQGETITGERAAENKQALALALRRDQIILQEASEKKAGGGGLRGMKLGGGQPKPKEISVFTRQFSVMIDSGVPMLQCLEILGETQENKVFGTAIQAV